MSPSRSRPSSRRGSSPPRCLRVTCRAGRPARPWLQELRASTGEMSTERELLYKVLFRHAGRHQRPQAYDGRADAAGVGPRSGASARHQALLPTTAQSTVEPPPTCRGYAESEEVTDEAPREKTKADMQREQIIRALRRNNGRRREPCRASSCRSARSTARSRNWE